MRRSIVWAIAAAVVVGGGIAAYAFSTASKAPVPAAVEAPQTGTGALDACCKGDAETEAVVDASIAMDVAPAAEHATAPAPEAKECGEKALECDDADEDCRTKCPFSSGPE